MQPEAPKWSLRQDLLVLSETTLALLSSAARVFEVAP